MGKRSKGLNQVQQRNMLKKSMLSSCKKYAEQLEAENYALKNDPNTVIGQFIGQFREVYSQNQRLSTLAAQLIRKLGDSVVVTKEELEAFQTKRINIKWEIADGETIETAKEYTFSYELEDAPPQGQPVQTTEQPGTEQPVQTDENGNLVGPVCEDPACEESHEHVHVPEGVVSPVETTE
jgi:hypothetical protein